MQDEQPTRRPLKDLKPYYALIHEIPVLAQLPEATRNTACRLLLQVGAGYVCEPGHVLCICGALEPYTGILLLKGTVEVASARGKRISVRAPELLGEMQQLDPAGQRTATVTAAEECVIVEFAWHDFIDAALVALDRVQQIQLKHAITEHADARFKQLGT